MYALDFTLAEAGGTLMCTLELTRLITVPMGVGISRLFGCGVGAFSWLEQTGNKPQIVKRGNDQRIQVARGSALGSYVVITDLPSTTSALTNPVRISFSKIAAEIRPVLYEPVSIAMRFRKTSGLSDGVIE